MPVCNCCGRQRKPATWAKRQSTMSHHMAWHGRCGMPPQNRRGQRREHVNTARGEHSIGHPYTSHASSSMFEQHRRGCYCIHTCMHTSTCSTKLYCTYLLSYGYCFVPLRIYLCTRPSGNVIF